METIVRAVNRWRTRRAQEALQIDLGVKLLTLYLLFVGPVVISALAFDWLASGRLKADVKAADVALASAVALETDTFISSALNAVERLGDYPGVIQSDPQEMERLFGTLMSVRSDVNLVYRLDSDGEMLYHYPEGPETTVGWDFSMRDYYESALKTEDALVSKGRISPTTHQPVATAVQPLWGEDGDFLGLVATNIKLQFLSRTLDTIVAEHLQESGIQILILDSAGQVIAHNSAGLLLANGTRLFPGPAQAVLTGNSGNLISPTADGPEMLYSYFPVPSSGWGVIVSRPTALAFATPRSIHFGALAALAIFLLFGFLFWIALSRQVIHPLERLVEFSQSIRKEESLPPDSEADLAAIARRPDQMGHLTRSLKRMDRDIQARFRELSTLLDTSAAVVSTLDSQTVLERILEQVERLMDIHMCAVVALDEEVGAFRVRASRGLSRHYVEHLAIDPREPQSVSLRAIRTGEAIQISDTETDPTYSVLRPRARAEGYRSVLAAPLSTQHAPPSALVVYRPNPHTFTREEINLLTSFANHAAMAIENAALYAYSGVQLQEQTRRLEALIQSLLNGLVLEDLDGRVLYTNRRTSELAGLPVEEIQGAPVEYLLNHILSRAQKPNRTRNAVQSALEGSGRRNVEITLGNGQGTRHLRLQIFDVTDAEGTRIGRGQIYHDITRLRELDRMKSSLVSTVSHELRTPLAAIKGYATTLLAEDVEWDLTTQREFLKIISDETDRLSHMVNNLLDMSRIEAGNLTVSRIPSDLRELIESAAQRAIPRARDQLVISTPEEIPPVPADPQRIEVVLRNLIENARKYAGDGSIIRISVTPKDDQVIVRVEDNGPGIPDEHQTRVFESFYRGDSGLRREMPGAGLGLAISQGFVRAHGGEIWLEPRARGTCVAFSLPMESADVSAQGTGTAEAETQPVRARLSDS